MASTEKRGGANDDIQVEAAVPNLERLEDVDLHDKALNVGAQEATAQEHSFGFIQGFKTYKRAAFWSISESASNSDSGDCILTDLCVQ